MTAFANSLATNIAVTVLLAVMVFLLPWTDRKICKKLGLNLRGGVSENPRADQLLRTRFILLLAAFCILLSVALTRGLLLYVTCSPPPSSAVRNGKSDGSKRYFPMFGRCSLSANMKQSLAGSSSIEECHGSSTYPPLTGRRSPM